MKITVRELKKMIAEAVQHGVRRSKPVKLGTTQPKYDVGSPEEKLIQKLFAASNLKAKFAGMSPEEIAAKLGLGDDAEVIALIGQLMNPSGLYR
jgi:hypothetical protein